MDESTSTIEEREELLAENSDVSDFERYSPEWREVVEAILEKLYAETPFLHKAIREFSMEKLITSESGRKVFVSLRNGIAVYGKLTDKQTELAMKIFRDHTPRLFEKYAADVGVIVE